MARLYSNENFPLAVVEELRLLGHDAVTSQDAGNANQSIPDDRVLEFAISEKRAVLTLNRLHFLRLHRQTPSHFGIVVCTFDPEFVGQAMRIHDALSSATSLENSLLRINRPS